MRHVAKARSPETVRHNVRQHARRNGHQLEPFRRVGALALWSAMCQHKDCWATVAIAGLSPIHYGGPALDYPCPVRATPEKPVD